MLALGVVLPPGGGAEASVSSLPLEVALGAQAQGDFHYVAFVHGDDRLHVAKGPFAGGRPALALAHQWIISKKQLWCPLAPEVF